MKISTHAHRVNPDVELILCFDVSKATLNLFSQYTHAGRTVRIEDEIANRTDAIEHVLSRCRSIADEAGLSGLRVLAEATGRAEAALDRAPPRPPDRTRQP